MCQAVAMMTGELLSPVHAEVNGNFLEGTSGSRLSE